MNHIKMVLRSSDDWSTQEQLAELMTILTTEDNLFWPEKFGDREPEKFIFDTKSALKVLEIWLSPTHWIFLKRKKPFVLSLNLHWWYRENKQLNEIRAHIDERYVLTPNTISPLLTSAKKLYSWGRIRHGYICTEEDWNLKNYFGIPTQVASGKKVSTGGLRLEDSLPGIYWANFFGPLYINFFGREKFLTAPVYYKEELPDGGFLLVTAPSPQNYIDEDVHHLEEALIDHLGRDAFFERKYPTKICRTPQITFEQTSAGHRVEIQEYDPAQEVIPNPLSFISNAEKLAEKLVKSFPGPLDYSPLSLRLLDAFILQQFPNQLHSLNQEATRASLQEFVAYYGEVLRRNLHGEWDIAKGTVGALHAVVKFIVEGEEVIEYPFSRVDKLWQERVEADGLAVRYFLFEQGELQGIKRRISC